ncbi:hypothetical protein HOO54_21610 [Bacillus sp. WMMC1349]|uniref:hypothetical protein n=1 Tax=Bacillus sp. WMMC1349 TaxID=2736254 RepID=UPI001554A5EB|nr:hypothetical protein [Bacillus sp. WMMC1349]NPC94749.1 hypothetical protein [Bacillus sp. WMMC1349]
MQLKEVLLLLNDGKSIADIAELVQKSERLIVNKLKSASIEFDYEEGSWIIGVIIQKNRSAGQ